MIVLGITGSVAMGKSTVAAQFAQLGAAVSDADKLVHRILETDASVKQHIAKSFPECIEAGEVNRQELGAMVFGNAAALKKLEAILHPRVRAQEEVFIKKAQQEGKWLVVLDIPLLYETGADGRCDFVAVVTAAESVQRQRVLEREGMTEEKFQQILSLQMPDEKKREKADFLIHTDQGMEHSLEQVKTVVEALRKENAKGKQHA